MADFDYDGYGGFPRITGGQVQKLIHLAGAVCSVALIAGVAFWGYKLAVRDVSGIPVIRAAEGSMRIAPSNPGGEVADHQGMAVNVIAEVGGAAALPQEIVLAPPPADLAPEDAAGLMAAVPVTAEPSGAAPALPLAAAAQLAAAAPSVGSPPVAADPPIAAEDGADPALTGLADQAAPVLPAEPLPVTTEDAVALALAEALAGDPAAVGLAEQPVQDAEVGAMNAPGDVVARSPRPVARPGGVARAPVTDALAISASVGPEIDASTLQAGTRLVQLGAFDSAELARGEWSALAGKFGDLMTGKSLVIQSAQSGGRTFYRLRAHGFEGEDDARRFCAALLAEDAPCIPVAHR